MLKQIAIAVFALGLGGCAPPSVRGSFLSAPVERKVIAFPIGETRSAEVGDAVYEQGDVTVTRMQVARLSAPVTSSLDLGHHLNLPAGAGGPLLTRSEGREPALCFPTSGGGQAVTMLSGSGITIACLVDLDKDGTFDVSMFSTREKYFPLSTKVAYTVETKETAIERKGSLKVDFIYQGFARGVLRFSYREFRDGLARPAFTQDLTYEAETDGSASIGFRGMRLRVLKATNQRIDYVVEKGMAI